ncbi:MAG: UDP-N-acetylglucosamine 2-epimerase [Pirellulaceae bacterium]
MRKLCVVIGSRANYSSIKSVLAAAQRHPDLDLQVIVGASALLDRYGSVVDLIEADGFPAAARVHMLIEGETPTTMAESTGLGLLRLPAIFEQLRPDWVLTVGDRFETIATAIAAAYMNIPLVHTMGGEVTGTIDESVRHAVTKLAHLHFPANQDAADRIVQMGEEPSRVFVVGCPRIDLVADIVRQDFSSHDWRWLKSEGVGADIDVTAPFLLVSQHPVTTEFGQGEQQIACTLAALEALTLPTVMLWPNADAGSDDVARGIRKFREGARGRQVRFYKNLPIDTYVRLMNRCACLIGNSSSAIREGEFLGVPAVNIGSRQNGRQRGRNILDVGHTRDDIVSAVRQQIQHGKYATQFIYGDGQAGEKISHILATVQIQIQKQFYDGPSQPAPFGRPAVDQTKRRHAA